MNIDAIRDSAEEASGSMGLLLVDVQVSHLGRRLLVRILADRPGRITVGECAQLSRSLGDLLDSRGVIAQEYTLEVSSPGVGRPLSSLVDWQRCRGRLLRVRTEEGAIESVLIDVEEAFLVMDGEVRIPLDRVLEAREVI